MGTPFIALLEPATLLSHWDRKLPSSGQKHPSIPRTFIDAMSVREQVYVVEQGVPQENEFDDDDGRSCHWVIYASVNIKAPVDPAIAANEDPITPLDDLATTTKRRPRRSETRSLPIGTIRLVPFPHPPHPRNGGVYVDGQLINAGEPVSAVANAAHRRPASPSSIPGTEPPDNNDADEENDENEMKEEEVVLPLTKAERARLIRTLPFCLDRATSLHDGTEPYIKLGRLAVLKEFRGRGIAGQLVRTAVEWMRQHQTAFNPSVTVIGFKNLGLGVTQPGEVPRWRGLVCCHAQEDAVKLWEKCGFEVDKGMGRWLEEGIPHVGMFMRVKL
ncbi:hypothetical protein B0H63DRAFT_138361 [Podospora didyma]|uniref:Glucosamine 6-phosphate N-acetyltransferase n=1 Tax=Podospora didyma TaxID=330526 RepID=A0AAE0U0R4_9PEZI|nr:hypothetical protein B0H63DRAFT_138361 [Podospora didyma]